MKKTLTLFSMLALTGCATPPAPLAWWFDRLDPCQSRGQANYEYPAFCGAGTGSPGYVIRDSSGKILGTVSK